MVEYGDRFWHRANVATPADLDDALRDLLTEAYSDAQSVIRVAPRHAS